MLTFLLLKIVKKISIDEKTITKSYYLKEALMKLQLSSSNGESKD